MRLRDGFYFGARLGYARHIEKHEILEMTLKLIIDSLPEAILELATNF